MQPTNQSLNCNRRKEMVSMLYWARSIIARQARDTTRIALGNAKTPVRKEPPINIPSLCIKINTFPNLNSTLRTCWSPCRLHMLSMPSSPIIPHDQGRLQLFFHVISTPIVIIYAAHINGLAA
ncbi:hypothetical protein BDBG_17114 [Blastomyces gilchristii SLH14081]|uniref:Uncharacterized protein n=1 Tax=Blastomyces gilchristii (strain SLH14081) TaxID=559298 RepID=A0A179ULN1_BLAGS|nr:uncharacterized protein BDBG_17114 [Blastomyces gilchristii SLH14081]OAT08790.1 hypothetical protein BDBG_17114 [Blastomyces gilchristii SLH14081]